MRQVSSRDSSQKTKLLVSRYRTVESFLQNFNPDYQKAICSSSDECFFGDYPTLIDVRIAYGENVPIAWLVPQLYNLSEYCGCRDKLEGKPLEECAFVIASEYSYLKVSELMLFFVRFKSGRYGKFYGSVDPLVITTSVRDFINERTFAYEQHDREVRSQREKEERKKAITYEEYLRRKESGL